VDSKGFADHGSTTAAIWSKPLTGGRETSMMSSMPPAGLAVITLLAKERANAQRHFGFAGHSPLHGYRMCHRRESGGHPRPLDFWQWGGGWWAGYHYCGGWAYQYGYAPHSCYIFGGVNNQGKSLSADGNSGLE
jgi:hypothetical protein